MTKRVVLVVSILTHYRVAFHEQVRALLAREDITYDLIVGTPLPHEAAKGDTVSLPWAIEAPNTSIHGLLWQPVLSHVSDADLVIFTQENRLLLNYILQIKRLLKVSNQRLAYFGHGRNFQARNRSSLAERWKRVWSTKVDWWFAYTDDTRDHLISVGYPEHRITVFNNAVDTSALRQCAESLTSSEITELRDQFGITGDNIAIFVGGLYAEKRLKFLVEAADHVRRVVPDFMLIVVGGGEDRESLEELARSRAWLILAGPRFGAEKAALMGMAKLFLMPGLLGLAVLDAGVMGLPVITTRYPWHSPEIAYLRNDETGVIVDDWEDPAAYASVVTSLLGDNARRENMSKQARAHVSSFTIEAMAERFAQGVEEALMAPKRF